jgi:anti-anti-sigma factor
MTGDDNLVFTSSPGVLSVSGEVDVSNSDELLQRVCQEASDAPLLLDLSGVDFMDSAGIRAILTAADHMRGGPLRIKPSPAIVRLFEVIRLDTAPGIELMDAAAPQDAEPGEASA